MLANSFDVPDNKLLNPNNLGLKSVKPPKQIVKPANHEEILKELKNLKKVIID